MVQAAVLVRSRRWKNCGGGKKTHSVSDSDMPHVHFQSKSREVVVDQFHYALQIFGIVKMMYRGERYNRPRKEVRREVGIEKKHARFYPL
jgi:hypothetical protein